MRQTTTPLPQLIYPRVINLRRRLQDLIYTPISAEVKNAQTNLESKSNDTSTANVAIFVGPVHKEYIPWEDAITETLEPIHVGDSFSPASFVSSQDGSEGVKEFPWTQRWFRIDVHILESGEQTQLLDQEQQQQQQQQHDQCEYCLYFLAHGEFTIYTTEGRVWCGIDPCHSHIPLSSLLQQQTQDQKGGRRQISCTLWLDGGQYQTGFWFGLQPPTEELGFRLLKVQLQRKNNLAYATYHDLSMLIEWVEYMYEREGIPLNTENGYYQPLISVSPCLRRVLYLLNQSCDGYDQTKTLASLQVGLQSIYQQFTTSSRDMKICHVGHAHMDLVWLWPERVTYQKIVHTYSNVLQLMNKYPQFTFTMSQPPLYYHILEKQPELAARISERIENGQWEFTGALEVV